MNKARDAPRIPRPEEVEWTAACPHGADVTWRSVRLDYIDGDDRLIARSRTSCPCPCPEPTRNP